MTVTIDGLITEQLKEGYKTFPLEKMKNIQDLRKLLEFLNVELEKDTLDAEHKDVIMEEATTLFFLKKYYYWLGEQTKTKPTKAKEIYSESINKLVLNEITLLNPVGGTPLVKNPSAIAEVIETKLTNEILQHWFNSYKQKTQPDPKGKERLERIKESYITKLRGGNKGLSQGTLMLNHANGGCLMFTSPKRDEVVVLYLVNSRKIEFQQKLPYETEVKKESIGGSVSGTTLKFLKETLRNFTNNSIDKNYWSEVLTIVEENI